MDVFPNVKHFVYFNENGYANKYVSFPYLQIIQVILQAAGYNCLGIILEEITCVLHVGYFNTDWTHTLH